MTTCSAKNKGMKNVPIGHKTSHLVQKNNLLNNLSLVDFTLTK